MRKKKEQQITIINNYVQQGNVVQTVSTQDCERFRPHQYDDYVFMFQSIMGFMALNKAVNLNHWRLIGMLIARMEGSGRIVAYPDMMASDLSLKDSRYIIKGIKKLLAWNIIYRPCEKAPDVYMFNQRFLYKGRVKDNFHPFAAPKLFPQVGYDVGPQPRIAQRIESNNDFDQEVDEVKLINQDYVSTEINNQ